MAEENIASPLTPEVTGSGGGKSRRNSMENIVPNYLRASTGSCHDICKYGKKQAFGDNARLPGSKRIGKKAFGERNSVESLDLQQVKKTSAVKLTPSPNFRSHVSDTSKFIRGKISSSKSRLSSDKAREFPLKTKRASDSLKNVSSLKLKSSSTDSGGSSGRRRSGLDSDIKNVVTSKAAVKQTLVSPRASLSPSSISGNASLVSKKAGSLDGVSSLKKQNEVEKVDLELPPKDFTKKQTKVNNDEPQLPSNESRESKSIALQEKISYVINIETENEFYESDESESCITESSPFPPSGSSSQSGGDQQESEWNNSEAENDSSSEISESENLDDLKNSKLVKLHFKRGKVVDIQTGLNSPRKLKFRRGRVPDEKQNTEALGQRSFETREAEAEINESDPSEEKFVLRHQDVQGKKGTQGLFNSVIEETQKSKVKALVGAFETLISLQEKKPAA